jgi:hypothetical protein
MSIADAQAIIEAWRVDYNQRRPHSSLRHLTPNEFILLDWPNQLPRVSVSVVNSAMGGAVFSNHLTVSARCFIFSTSPA